MKLNKKLLVFFVFAFGLLLSAQSERKITRSGNTQYETGNFVEAEINYKKALEHNPTLLEAQFNLGDALAKQERYEEALASFDLVTATTEDAELKASAFHNKGNVQLKQQDLEGAVASYEESLRANPKDSQTRYNYAYAKKQLAQQQEQEQEQEQEQDQNEEDKEDKEDKEENKDSKDKGDQNKEDSENKDSEDSKEKQEKQDDTKEDSSEKEPKDKGETDGQESEDEKQKQEQEQEQEAKAKENKLSPEEAQRLLDALKQEENKVQAKMKKHKIKGAKVKIEKDW